MRAKLERVLPLLPIVGGAGACAVDETPPTIVDAQFEDENVLVVRFSEPIAPVTDVDAESHFRLGSAFYVESLELTAYYDLAHHFPEGVPGVDEALAESWFRHGFTLISKIEHGSREDELRLFLSYRLEPYVCDILPVAEELGIPAGIHLHYSTGSFPRITDLAGNELADNGGWWVLGTFATTIEGAFPRLDVRMPIPCPEL